MKLMNNIDCIFNWIKYILFGFVIDILLLFVFLLRRLSPKDKRIWVVVSKDLGPPFDNTKYFFLLGSKLKIIKQNNIYIYFISKDKNAVDKLKSRGYHAELFPSLKSLSLLLHSWYIIHDYVSYRYAFLYKLAYDVELWHGVGIKKVGWQQGVGKCGVGVVKYICPFIFRPDIFFATSPYYLKHFKNAYKLKKNNIYDIGNYPRNVALLQETIDEDIGLCTYRRLPSHKHILVYLPTFRFNYSAIHSTDLYELNSFLKKINAILIIKLHPNDKKSYFWRKKLKNIFFLNKNCDVYPILRKTDILITDFSSVAFDFMLTKKPILLYLPDKKVYIHSERGLILDPEDLGLPVYKNINELKSGIIYHLTKTNRYMLYKKYRKILKMSFSDPTCPHKSINNIVDKLLSHFNE